METAKTTIRIDRETLARIREAAKKDGRSVNQQVIFYIRQALGCTVDDLINTKETA